MPVRRLVRPPRSKFKVGQKVVGLCDAIMNAHGEVVEVFGAIDLVGPFPDYKNIVAPGITLRVTQQNGDHTKGDLLCFHDTYVMPAEEFAKLAG